MFACNLSKNKSRSKCNAAHSVMSVKASRSFSTNIEPFNDTSVLAKDLRIFIKSNAPAAKVYAKAFNAKVIGRYRNSLSKSVFMENRILIYLCMSVEIGRAHV